MIPPSSFVSYSQNYEDVLLFRAVGHIENGFYVDIGAAHPTLDSVTKAFYDRGWSGINVEPSKQYFSLLAEERDRDRNVECVISTKEGEIEFWDVAETGNSTIDEDLAERCRQDGYHVSKRTVESRTLSSISDEIEAEEVHFLKIDVEEAELQVLESADFSSFRPWIILIEATVPNSRTPNHENWEHVVMSNRYQFVFFDGLNRYYIAEEHPELADSFTSPACIFDDFITLRELTYINETNRLRELLSRAEDAQSRKDQVVERLSGLSRASESIATDSVPSADGGLEKLNQELKEVIRDRDREIVEMAEMNLELTKRLQDRKAWRGKARKLLGLSEESLSISEAELEARLSSLRLELKQRFRDSDEKRFGD